MGKRRSSANAGSAGLFLSTSTMLHMLCIIVACVVAYSNTFHVPFQFDDEYQISEKSFVRDINSFFDMEQWRSQQDHGFKMRTIGYLSLALNYRINGTHVVGYHVVNLAIHIMNGLLVYWLVSLTFKTPYFSMQHAKLQLPPPVLIALFTALLFVSHPVQTQAVTYIVQRLTSLATFWYLLGISSYVRWRVGESSGLKAIPWYALSLVSLVLGMKTKEIVFTAPLVICLYEFTFFRGPLKRRIFYLLPLLATMLIIPVSLLGVTKPLNEVISDVSEATKVQTDISRWDYLLTEFRVIVTYLRLLVLPVNQNLDYDYPIYRSLFDPNVFLSFLFLSTLFGAGVYLYYKSRVNSQYTQRGTAPATHSSFLNPLLRLVAFGIFWFFMTLSVESSIIPIADVIFEHRLYLPAVGLYISAATTVSLIWARYEAARGKKAVFALVVLIALLTGLTYMRNNVWRSDIGLWEDVVRKSPMKARSYINLGKALATSEQLVEAASMFERAIAMAPNHPFALNDLGAVLNDMGRPSEAVSVLERAIANKPDYPEAYYNLGRAYLLLKDNAMAINYFSRAISLKPTYADAYANIAVAYNREGRFADTIRLLQDSYNQIADSAEGHFNLCIAYSKQGNWAAAAKELQTVQRFNPELGRQLETYLREAPSR